MRPPIAYTYEADTHCPDCAVARFGAESICPPDCAFDHRDGAHWFYPWPPEDARDSEGNPIGAIAPWDDWCNGEDEALCTLACGDCLAVLDTHGPHITPED